MACTNCFSESVQNLCKSVQIGCTYFFYRLKVKQIIVQMNLPNNYLCRFAKFTIY